MKYPEDFDQHNLSCRIRRPTPSPPAIPRSASLPTLPVRIYHTAHNRNRLDIKRNMSCTIDGLYLVCKDRSRSILFFRKVGQKQPPRLLCESPSVFRILLADSTSSSGAPVRETRMVSPIPDGMIPSPIADLIFPEYRVPASVIPHEEDTVFFCDQFMGSGAHGNIRRFDADQDCHIPSLQ